MATICVEMYGAVSFTYVDARNEVNAQRHHVYPGQVISNSKLR